jgi:hypothetical protein
LELSFNYRRKSTVIEYDGDDGEQDELALTDIKNYSCGRYFQFSVIIAIIILNIFIFINLLLMGNLVPSRSKLAGQSLLMILVVHYKIELREESPDFRGQGAR